MQITYM